MSFQFAHISDLHLPPLPVVTVRDVLNKRLLGWPSWHRKRTNRHPPAVAAALERFLGDGRVDHICITGDVTNLGPVQEFQAADCWLSGLASREMLTFVPGNHDAYTTAAIDAVQTDFGRWLPDGFPSVTRRNGALFIGMSRAVPACLMRSSGVRDICTCFSSTTVR